MQYNIKFIILNVRLNNVAGDNETTAWSYYLRMKRTLSRKEIEMSSDKWVIINVATQKYIVSSFGSINASWFFSPWGMLF